MKHLYSFIVLYFLGIVMALASHSGNKGNNVDSASSASPITAPAELVIPVIESEAVEPEVIQSAYAVSNLPDYMEKTYLYNINGDYAYAKDTNLVFEAQLAPAYTIYNSISKPKRYTSAMTVSSEVHIRMLYAQSVPLVPPSYKVHFKYFGFLKDKHSGEVNNTFLFSMNHHSNGKSKNIAANNKTLDLENGNFSSQYLTLFYYHTFRQSNGKFPVKYDLGIGLEKHSPDSLFGYEVAGAMIDCLSENYGRNRLWLTYSVQQKIASKFKLLNGADLKYQINYMYVLNQPKGNQFEELKNPEVLPRYMLNAELQFKPNWRSNVGFFTRLRSGQDDYNVYFFKNLTQFQFGIVVDQFQFKRN